MRKISIFLVIVLTIVAAIGFKYMSYKNEYNAIQKENKEFEEYKDKEVYGLEVGTMINKAVDKNTKNKIEKDNNGNFIQNDKNSIEIEIYITDNETTYKMETIYNAGTEQFVQYYGNIKFKCSKIEYHENTGRIKYMLFEQQETS
ncbi:MAG: hypothetical protein V8R51_08070 [Clostridia bacterium]